MGVPSFYRWLVNRYPKIVVDVRENTSTDLEFDNLYLDMNGIIHPCFHPELDNVPAPTTFEDVFKNIYDYIDNLFDIVKPRKLLYMAIDGVAPRAKLNQQRARRFRTAKDNETAEEMEETLRMQFERERKQVLPKEQSELSDRNIITPGTQFMCSLSKKLQQYIKLQMTKDTRWRTIKVIFSDANVPGEGEQKIMSFIRSQRCCADYDPNTRHCLYGLDADLIMLALATHEVHFSILREDVLAQEETVNCVSELQRTAQHAEEDKQKSRGWFEQVEIYHPEAASISEDKKMNGRAPIKKIPFQFLNVWILREYLQMDMCIENLPEKLEGKIDLERIIDDFVFICFFVGNDFLPHMPTLAIHEGALDLLLHVYKNEFKKLGGYLIDAKRIEDKKAGYLKLKRVEKYILSVGEYEDKIFKKRAEMRDRKIRRIIDAENADSQECFGAKFERDSWYSDSTSSNGKASGDICPPSTSDGNKSPFTGIFQTDADVLKNTRELKQQLKDQIRQRSDTFRGGNLGVDKVKLGTPGYKERYYDEKFSTKKHDERERKRREVVQKYTEGLCWVLKYYYAGVPSWNWFYPFHYGPFASDFRGLSQVKITFKKGLPFKPFDQLMAVLPPQSVDVLPEVCKKLMLDKSSNIMEFYPTDFEVDFDGKRYLWQGICKLPFIQEERLLTETKIIENELKEHEKQRNAVAAHRLFLSSSSLGEEIISSIHKSSLFSTESNVINIKTLLSNGISGFIRLEFNGLIATDFSDKSEDPDVLCFFYELPDDCLPNPHLLEGVNVPEKTITEEDLLDEPVLWHEGSGNGFNRRPLNQIQKLKYCKKNEEPDIVHTYGGIGWGRGRGKSCSISGGQTAIGHQQVSELCQGFKSSCQSANRNFRQSSSTSTPRRSDNDWRLEKEFRATLSEQQFTGWKNANANHSWSKSQPFSSSSIRQPSQQHLEECKDGKTNLDAWRRGQPFSPSSAQQQSYGRGRGNYQPRAAHGIWRAKDTSGGSFQ